MQHRRLAASKRKSKQEDEEQTDERSNENLRLKKKKSTSTDYFGHFPSCGDTIPNTHTLKEERFILGHISAQDGPAPKKKRGK